MSLVEIGLMFMLGLVSSLHCLQMCGPIVISYSVSLASRGVFRNDVLLAHVAYNGGRILTYMTLGAVAGAAGGGLGMLGRLAGLAAGGRLFAGAAMIVTGILMLRALPAKALVQIERRGAASRFSQAVAKLLTSAAPGGKFALGLLLGFLPCGLVYGALLKAMETASAAGGALTMLAFGLGTAVALFGTGVASSFAGLRLGGWGTRLAGTFVLLGGALLVWRGLTAGPVCHG